MAKSSKRYGTYDYASHVTAESSETGSFSSRTWSKKLSFLLPAISR